MRGRLGFISLAMMTAAASATGSVFYGEPVAVSAAERGAEKSPRINDPAPQRLEAAQNGQEAQPPSPLPGGASSIDETYKDWRVVCVQQGVGKHCAFLQNQVQNGRRALGIELQAAAGNAVSGILMLPFGLALDQGVAVAIDSGAASLALPFRTCLPAGCVVAVNFDKDMVRTLRTATALKVKTAADGGNPATFSISLQGFATALDRVTILSR
ncbi:invasion associated locus B family protein [Rhizobium vallis]|nr:invasion associated locus B family protein [Rhizobium vallis]